MRAYICLSCASLLCSAAFGQSTETRPTFEVADIHTSAHTTNPFMRGPFNRGGRYELRNATMVDLVLTAYGVDADKVLGGPSWLEMDRFDVIAKAPGNSTAETRKAMLQALLADRFKLVVHNDTRQMPAYALTVGKHSQLKEGDGSGDTGCKLTFAPSAGPQAGGAPPAPPMLMYACHNMTMAAFAEGMRNMTMASQWLNGNPVVDQTELKGSWDFNFKYSLPLRGPAAAASDATSLLDAVEKQLGLKLERVKVPMAVIVVDSVNQKPTANSPGVTESLQTVAPPTEFEVADVKPTDPEFKGIRFQIQPGGRVNLEGVTLKFMILQAWNISEEMLVGAPKWLDTDRFTIVAKVATAGPPAGPGSGPDIDIDTVYLMLRGLLAERFKLATHNEERMVLAYALVAGKPKLTKADPTSRTRFQEGPAADGKDPRTKNPALSRLVTCQNMTMAQFAERLQGIAPGYIKSPVTDATGIDGAWDFTLSFSPAGLARGGGGRGGRGGDGGPPPAQPSGDVLAASDPISALSLFEAIDKQLGLRLEPQKRPASVLVIDHVEQKPTDN
jgi:uncharacterized protein (TIGR03435 family)